jgi:hypothetical protein
MQQSTVPPWTFLGALVLPQFVVYLHKAKAMKCECRRVGGEGGEGCVPYNSGRDSDKNSKRKTKAANMGTGV